MTRYADPERCPDCGAAMPYGASRCPGCGLSLEGPLAARLFQTLSTADSLLASLRSTSAPSGPAESAPTVPASPALAPDAAPSQPRPARRGLTVASVPRILLGLGALCLLVAALVFLAVTWSTMGVAGRTATLIGFTAVAGGLATWAARRELRAAAEALSVVALGLLAFDLFGARSAGWFGDTSTAGFVVALGGVLLSAGAAAAQGVRRTPVRALVGAEVFAVIGLACMVGGGVAADWAGTATELTVGVVLAAGVCVAAYAVRLLLVSVGAVLVGLTAWLMLGLLALERAVENPTLQALWLEAEGWPLLVTAGLAAAVTLVRRLPFVVRLLALGAATLTVATALLVPLVDATATQAVLGAAVLVAAASGLATVVPQPWARSFLAPVAPGAVAMLLVAAGLSTALLTRVLDAGAAWWTGAAADRFGPVSTDVAPALLPVSVVALAAALTSAGIVLPAIRPALRHLLQRDLLVSVAVAVVALTLAGHPVPLWTVLALLLVAGGGFVLRAMRAPSAPAMVAGAVLLAVAVLLSLHAEWLTLLALTVLLLAAFGVHLGTRRLEVSVGAGVVLSATVAGLAWTIGVLAGVPGEWTAAAAIVALAALTLAAPLVDERWRVSAPASLARLGMEVGALGSAAALGLGGVEAATPTSGPAWAAVYLTLVGAAASAMALLRPDRRSVGWLGGLLLAAASWVRLGDLGVDMPEAYTLPSAVALLVVGLLRLRGEPGSSTVAALSPGLALALVPSLLWVLADPTAARSVALGAGCLGLVVGGARLRWSAPVLWGASVGALVVLRHTAPLAEAVPRWVLIGGAGALLVAMGISWERRVRDARAVAGYVRGLR